MGRAKDIIVKVIPAKIANEFVKRWHYSGKVVQNSQLHFGAFLDGVLHGVMQFGPSLDKRKIQGLVSGTKWNEFIELNRMAFDDVLPRNSESRCIAVAMKLLRKNAPHLKWVISFADGAQCGDGAIYRASGFLLTSIKENQSNLIFPDGEVCSTVSITAFLHGKGGLLPGILAKKYGVKLTGASYLPFIKIGAKPIPGYQLRYIYFIDKTQKKNLTVPILPFSKIDEIGAGMYKGENISIKERQQAHEAKETKHPATSREEGGSSPTHALKK